MSAYSFFLPGVQNSNQKSNIRTITPFFVEKIHGKRGANVKGSMSEPQTRSNKLTLTSVTRDGRPQKISLLLLLWNCENLHEWAPKKQKICPRDRIGTAKFARLCFFWWLLCDVLPVRLSRRVSFLVVTMKSFSVRHGLQRYLKIAYSFAQYANTECA